VSENRADRGVLLDAILTRAADQLSDLTEPVMQRFYWDFRDAKAKFEHHDLGKRERLEAEIVETALYSQR
jgi:hypothetical protein